MSLLIKKTARRFLPVLMAALLAALCLSGCTEKPVLNPRNPTTITIWHYYNGSILNAFDSMVQEFNDTVGRKLGIIVEGYNYGNVSELEKAVLAAAAREVGSREIPSIFASYADTAYEAEKLGILADIGRYFSPEEQMQYLDSYIDEGKIGLEGELRIFPIAKSTEVFMLNLTDWAPFADATGATLGELSTIQGLARVAEQYYGWSDALTPNIPDDGKAFFGRDSMANMFIIASKEFGIEIFQVDKGICTLNINEDVMRMLWDYYYVPYISGHYTSYSKFRSDDAKVGDIIAYVGATSSASYFPTEVTVGGRTYPIEAAVLPVPHFESGRQVLVQQGAGMVVTKSGTAAEYASVEFLKWFTDTDNNSLFAAMSGYMPVKKGAIEYQSFLETIAEKGQSISAIADETLRVSFLQMETCELYTNKAFYGGSEARSVLEYSLQDKAVADRDAVAALVASGVPRGQAIGQYNTEEGFRTWLASLTDRLNEAIR